jgi:hypothetical protein
LPASVRKVCRAFQSFSGSSAFDRPFLLSRARAEIRILAAVGVAPARRRMDEPARERRELDTAIQQANWATDLVED